MHLIFSGLIALVTGASKGMGRSIAAILAQAGARVVISSRARGELGFQLGDAGFQRRGILFHLRGGEARGDVLRAVPVVGNDLDEEQALHLAAERFGGELIDQLGMLARVEHAGVAEQLEPGAVRVVHHEEGHPIGDVKVARADKLAVAFEIREADKVRSQHLYESRWTSAVLHVGPACLAYGRHVEAVARGNEVSFATRERVGLGCILHDLVLSEVFVLGLLHGGREHELHVFVSHSVYFSRSDFTRFCAWFSDPMVRIFGFFSSP